MNWFALQHWYLAEDAEEGAGPVRATPAGLHPGVPPELLQDGRRRRPPGDLLRTHRKEITVRTDPGAAPPDVDQAPARRGGHPEEDRRRRVRATKTKVLR